MLRIPIFSALPLSYKAGIEPAASHLTGDNDIQSTYV